MTEEERETIVALTEELMRYKSSTHTALGMTKDKLRGKIRSVQGRIDKIKNKYEDTPAEKSIIKLEKEVKDELLRSKRLKLTPDDVERRIIEEWIGASRFIYNQCVREYKRVFHGVTPMPSMTNVFRPHMRDFVDLKVKRKNKWLSAVPGNVIRHAIEDFVKAWDSNIAKKFKRLKKGENFSFDMHFRSKKYAVQETISVNARDYNASVKGAFGFLKYIRCTEGPLPRNVDHEIKISRTRSGAFYMSIPYKPTLGQCKGYDVIALDPGERTFMTGYDTGGVIIEWGAGDMKDILYRLKHADRLRSEIANEESHQRRRRKRKAMLKIFRKIRERVSYLHKRMCAFLTRVYKCILLPEFETSKMTQRKMGRALTCTSVRKLLTWGHYRFRQLLIAKVEATLGCTLVICNEHHTTKTCGACGALDHNLGGSKTYACAECGYVADRDANAARNILLRFLERAQVALRLICP